ncbi:MAG: winged helix DNA-binding domain-containing protein [Solirubrobacterales bacterium]
MSAPAAAPGSREDAAQAREKAGELLRLARVRGARQLLHRPRASRHPADILRAIAGAQAQEPPSGRLAVRSRHPTLTAADIERARTEERSVIRLWAMRNTAHLIATEDLPFIRPLFAPLMESFNRRRLAHFGIEPSAQDRVLELISEELERHGPLTRTELSERIERAGISVDPQVRAHVFPLAVSTRIACLGAGDGGATELVAAGDWLADDPPDLEREGALAELARRYFAAFGPASEADFAGWAGLPLGDVRAAMKSIAAELREVSVLGAPAWQPRGRAPRPIEAGLVRLLPAFDTYLMGHRERRHIAPAARWAQIGPGGGILHPAITCGGRAIGTWRLRRRAGKLESELLPFGDLDAATARAVDAELGDVARFEGRPSGRAS